MDSTVLSALHGLTGLALIYTAVNWYLAYRTELNWRQIAKITGMLITAAGVIAHWESIPLIGLLMSSLGDLRHSGNRRKRRK